MRLILASASPRRRQLLDQLGIDHEVDPSGIVEAEPSPGEDPAAYASTLAHRKAWAVAIRRPEGLILGADTVCAVGGQILNKPLDRDDAERMIRLQEGRDTEVWTGLCLLDAAARTWRGRAEVSVVHFRPLTDRERREHLDSGRWEGKAGGYGVQDDDPFITLAWGSRSNVVGLPTEHLVELLREVARGR